MDAKLLELFVLALAIQVQQADTLTCRGLYYKASRIQSEPMGFCWYFFNGNFTVSDAETLCKQHDGHLPAINSYTKADKLAQFASGMRNLYYNGSFDHSWLPVYAGGWEGLTLWGDRVTRLDDQMVWNNSGAIVSYQGFDESTEPVPEGDSCTVFNMSTGMWRFSKCEGVNTVVCEEGGHEYEDESPDVFVTEAWTTAENPGAKHNFTAESCPAHFTLSRGRCLMLGHVSGVYAANEYCTLRDGYLAVATDANDETMLSLFITDHKIKKWSNFLSPVEYTGERFIWTSTGQTADYVAQKLDLIPKQSLLYDTLVVMTPDGRLTTCYRHKCNARAFCQANGEDYYAYPEETDFDDF